MHGLFLLALALHRAGEGSKVEGAAAEATRYMFIGSVLFNRPSVARAVITRYLLLLLVLHTLTALVA